MKKEFWKGFAAALVLVLAVGGIVEAHLLYDPLAENAF